MKSKILSAAGSFALAGSLVLFGTTNAIASDNVPTTQQSASDLNAVGMGLKNGNAPRDTKNVSGGTQVTYHLNDGSNLTFTYDESGNLAAAPAADGTVHTNVSAGFDPFPYVDLDTSEQGAAAGGAAGTLGTAICAALGPETAGAGCAVGAGVAATIIAIAASHGVCPDGGTLRVHLNGNASCRK